MFSINMRDNYRGILNFNKKTQENVVHLINMAFIDIRFFILSEIKVKSDVYDGTNVLIKNRKKYFLFSFIFLSKKSIS